VNADTLAQCLAVTLILFGVLVLFMPVGECSECPHCRIQRLAGSYCFEHKTSRSQCFDQHREK
jgi:hypothetical protein